MRLITVFNQKGGVGKTMSSLSIGEGLSILGKKVCIVEKDPQSNIRKLFFRNAPPNASMTLADLFNAELNKEHYNPNDAIVNIGPNLDLMITLPSLAVVESELTLTEGSEFCLKSILSSLTHYDYIIIDNPPALGNLTINSLTAADAVLIPIDTGPWALEGVDELLKTFRHVRKKFNKALTIEGVLLTKAKEGGKNTRHVRIALSQDFEGYFFDTYINECVHFDNAIRVGKTIFGYTTKSGKDTLERAQKQYMAVAKAIISKNEGGV